MGRFNFTKFLLKVAEKLNFFVSKIDNRLAELDFTLILFSVFALFLSFPPLSLPIVGFIALMPLMVSAGRGRPFFKFFVAGFALFAANLYFINYLQIEARYKIAIFFGYVALSAYLAIYYAVFGWLFSKSDHRSWGDWLLFPSLWVAMEWLRSVSDTGFPWLPMWATQLGDLPIAKLASIIGPFGVSWLVVFMNYWAYKVVKLRSKRLGVSWLIVVALLHLVGFGLMDHESWNDGNVRTVRVAVLQPNVLPRALYDPKEWGETVKAFDSLIDSVRERDVDIVILSESAFPGFYRLSKRTQNYVRKMARRIGAPVLFGSADFSDQSREIYNAVFVVDTNGELIGRYYKVQLVPFSEHLPFEERIDFLKRIDLGQSDYRPGHSLEPIDIGKAKLGVLICFESIFPRIARKEVQNGAELLVNVTNDGWFGKTLGPMVHFELARFRAIETGRFLVRSAKTGISAVVDPNGRIVRSIGLFKYGFFVEDVPVLEGDTLYLRIGDVAAWLSLAIVALFALVALFNYAFRILLRRRTAPR